MLHEACISATVYQVLDQVLADGTVAPRSRGMMFSVVDSLKHGPAAIEDVRRAERIAIEMHKLEWALQQGNPAHSCAALNELRSLAALWLDSRICS